MTDGITKASGSAVAISFPFFLGTAIATASRYWTLSGFAKTVRETVIDMDLDKALQMKEEGTGKVIDVFGWYE